jgi:hypothetical protein
MSVETLPPAPRVYSQADQTQLRRILNRALRDIENRLRALENV